MCSNIDICYVILFPVLNLIHSELVAALKQIRIAQGITAVKLSSKVFPSEKSITMIEIGRKKLYLTDYLRLCKVLRINPMALIMRCQRADKVKLPSNNKSPNRGRPKQIRTVYAQDITHQPQDVGDKP